MKNIRSAATIVLLCLFFTGLFTTMGCTNDKPDQLEGASVCGGVEGITCPKGQFCELPEGKCGVADLDGVCLDQPAMCTRDYRPVCGCDGKTYGNDCDRMSAGVQKSHDGECGTQ